jgi:DNA polymerase-3 subunit epsilon
MRLIMLDTETTGLRVEEGHRVLEIGCVECIDRRVTDHQFHAVINPEREVDEGAAQVHGMRWEQLKDKPIFSQVVDEFLGFINGARLVIHNAEFDRGFLDSELRRLGREPLSHHVESVVDSLAQARELHPGQKNSLDALCQRYEIRNEHRVLHGALLDARLLAEVYLMMTRGQESLAIHDPDDSLSEHSGISAADLAKIVVRRASAAERLAHEAVLADIDQESNGKTIWPRRA